MYLYGDFRTFIGEFTFSVPRTIISSHKNYKKQYFSPFKIGRDFPYNIDRIHEIFVRSSCEIYQIENCNCGLPGQRIVPVSHLGVLVY